MLQVSDPDLIAHWPFREDLKDHSESGLSIQNYGVEIGESGGQKSAQFNGAETFLEVPCDLSIGTGDFSCVGWIHIEETEVELYTKVSKIIDTIFIFLYILSIAPSDIQC